MNLRRIWGFVAVSVATVLMTTGCIKLEMDMTVAKDDTVSGTMVFALAKSVADLAEQSSEDQDSSEAVNPVTTDNLFANSENVVIEAYDDGSFVGTSYTFENIPLAQLAPEVGDNSTLAIKRQGDNLVVSGVLDTSSEGESLEENPLGDSFVEVITASTSIRITITLPGEILETNGVVDGQSITWTGKFGQKLDIQAVAVSPLEEPINWLVVGGLIGLLLALVGGLSAWLLTRKKPKDGDRTNTEKLSKENGAKEISSKETKAKKLTKEEILAAEALAARPWYQKKRFAFPAIGMVALSLVAIAAGLLLPKSGPSSASSPGSANDPSASSSATSFPEPTDSPKVSASPSAGTGSSSGSQSAQPAPPQAAPAPEAQKVEVPPPANRVPPAQQIAPSESDGQLYAREDALFYWSSNWYSRNGLINWLVDNGHSYADASYGVDSLGVDWFSEASGMANYYISDLYFSRVGLIAQLEYEGFTTSQATFGVDSLKYDWFEEAYYLAWEYIQNQGFTEEEAYAQLISEYFTAAEAEYGSYWAANPE